MHAYHSDYGLDLQASPYGEKIENVQTLKNQNDSLSFSLVLSFSCLIQILYEFCLYSEFCDDGKKNFL